jgi:hypothetical protein
LKQFDSGFRRNDRKKKNQSFYEPTNLGSSTRGGVLSKPWRASPLYRQESFFVGEAFSLDRRGWKAAPTENDPTYLKENN